MSSVNLVSHDCCTGCGLCAQVCPVGAIGMHSDSEGFAFPVIDGDLCIECAKCLKGCSAAGDIEDTCRPSSKAYIARSSVHETWRRSSSGGIAFAASRFVLDEGGLVAACVIDSDGVVRHRLISDADELWRSQGSKYVQSDISGIYKSCREACESGRTVLFVGTPCQVFAVRHYLDRYKDRLLTIDLICHGVPSPSFWQRDLEYQQGRNRLTDVERVLFRWTSGFERTSYALGDGRYADRKVLIDSNEDAFYSAFMRGISFRESCYSCKFANLSRTGDMTIGDCATADDYLSFDMVHPVSTVLLNSEAGNRLFMRLLADGLISAQEIDLDAEASRNAQLSRPALRPSTRSEVYLDLESKDYESFIEKYATRPSFAMKAKTLIKVLVPVKARQAIKRCLKRR